MIDYNPSPPPRSRRLLVCLGLVVIVVALFYSEENRRGQAVWEQCKRQFAAQGQLLDWDVYTPVPVRPSLNFFQAPRMQGWFQGRGMNDLTRLLQAAAPTLAPVAVCEVTVVGTNPAPADLPPGEPLVLRYLNSGAALFLTNDSTAGSDAVDEIDFDNVPPADAIAALAKQASLNFAFDPATGITRQASNSFNYSPRARSIPPITARFRHFSARQALLSVLNRFEFQMINDPAARLERITLKELGAPNGYASDDARAAIRAAADAALGPRVQSPHLYPIFARPLDQVKPARIVWRCDTTPTTNQIADFAAILVPDISKSPSGHFQVEMTASNTFRVSWNQCCAAADYLAKTDSLQPEFAAIREALTRPFARMSGDFQNVQHAPVQNFVTARVLSQTLATRAQCDLLLGQPDKALQEITFIHDYLRIFQDKPATLVAAMIHVAIAGLYNSVIADALKRHAWQEPQLAALQEQLGTTPLLPLVAAAFSVEAAAGCSYEEQSEDEDFVALIQDRKKWWRDPEVIFHLAMPRGWVYQNMAVVARLDLAGQGSVDYKNHRVWPRRADEASVGLEAALTPFSPYTVMARIATPNYSKAVRAAARNQSLLDQTRLVCALERFRLARGQYPATLAELAPSLIDPLPDDLIGGHPLKYHRTADDQFRLYSIGWDGADNAGDPQKDWVWGEAL